jgi:predicted DNA-binding protein
MTSRESVETRGKGMDAVVVVRLPESLRDALRRRAQEEDRTMASLLRVAARAYLERTP